MVSGEEPTITLFGPRSDGPRRRNVLSFEAASEIRSACRIFATPKQFPWPPITAVNTERGHVQGEGSIEIAAYTSARSKRNCVAAISVRQTARQPSREPNHTPAS